MFKFISLFLSALILVRIADSVYEITAMEQMNIEEKARMTELKIGDYLREVGQYSKVNARYVVTAYAFFLGGIPFQIIRNFHMDIFLAHPSAFFFPFLCSSEVREQYYIPALQHIEVLLESNRQCG